MGFDIDLLFLLDEAIDPDYRLLTSLLAQCYLVAEVGNLALEPALFDPFDGAASGVDLGQQGEDLFLEVGGQALHVIRTTKGIDYIGDVGLLGDDLLSAQGNLHRLFGRDGERFVHAIGVQTLGPAQHCRQSL